MFQVTLKNGTSYPCQQDQTLFEGARSNGIFLDHSCLTARCSSCKVRITSGDTQSLVSDFVLSDEEREAGFVLSCNCTPLSDISIEAEDLTGYNLNKPKTVPAKISSIELITPAVLKLTLRTPPRQKLEFLEGQYVDIIKGSVRRSYSIASSNSEGGSMDFLIKNYHGGMMSSYLFNEAATGDLLRVEGPKGTFFKRNSDKKNIVFLATGTGIAPVNSILEQLKNENQEFKDKQIYVFWGMRYISEFFDLPVLKSDRINFHPVLSRPDEKWQGKSGYVQQVAQQILGNFTRSQVYACGSDAMIKSAKQLMIENGLEESLFYADAFVQTN
jgi:CDP-4-dehydro-6-deoxyglucose reductase